MAPDGGPPLSGSAGGRAPHRWRAGVGVATLAVLLCSPAAPDGGGGATPVVLRVILNGEERGDHFFDAAADGDLLIRAEDLAALGILVPGNEAPAAPVSLRSLAPRLRFRLEEQIATLELEVTADLLPETRVDFAERQPAARVVPRSRSTFLNYQLSATSRDGGAIDSWDLPLELGVRAGPVLALSTFAGARRDGNDELRRLSTSFLLDDPLRHRRLVLGDSYASSGAGGSVVALGGISVVSDFSLDPGLRTLPGLDLAGILETPSEMEIYVDGALLRRERLPAGRFELLSLPVVAGAGEVVVVVRDVYGRERRLLTPFYAPSSLLAPGLGEFGYSVGVRRRQLGRHSTDYGDACLLAYHRHGFSRGFTAGFRAEASEALANVGLLASRGLGRWGELELAVSAGRSRGDGSGWAGQLSHRYQGRRFFQHWRVDGISAGYETIQRPAAGASRWAVSGAAGTRLGRASVSLRLDRRWDDRGEERRLAALTWSQPLSPALALTGQAERIERTGSRPELRGTFAAQLRLGGERTARLAIQARRGHDELQVGLSRLAPRDEGISYRAELGGALATSHDGTVRGGVTLEHGGRHGRGTLDLARSDGRQRLRLAFAGSLALLGGSLHASRPLTDGFGLVRVGSVAGVGVRLLSQPPLRTNRRGEVFLPNLAAHRPSQVALEVADLPFDRHVEQPQQSASPPHRGGVVLAFDVHRFQGFEGRLRLAGAAPGRNADYAALTLDVAGESRETVVGNGGLFYLEGLPQGRWPGRLRGAAIDCRFVLDVPASEQVIVDLGEVRCAPGEP